MSNYPDDIARHNNHPLSPSYEETEYKCKRCGEVFHDPSQLTKTGICIDCIDDDSVDNYD